MIAALPPESLPAEFQPGWGQLPRQGQPRATARLQLHAGFTLADAQQQVDYYYRLGVSHLYLSPVTTARAGSTHGYDVIDHTRVNPELGGEPALRELADRVHRYGMGLLLDIVPNHMAAHPDNAWWWDMLQHGPASVHARTFDITWRGADPALHDKVLLPVLGNQYGQCLADGDLALAHDAQRGYFLSVHGNPYPIAPGTLAAAGGEPAAGQDSTGQAKAHEPAAGDSEADDPAATLARFSSGDPAGRERLHALLQAQHYRLAWWRCAPDQINWRRFFEITELAGVRVEQPEVFDAVHEMVLRLYAEGVVDGLRIDHIDGLADPAGYTHQLHAAMAQARPDAEPYIVVEKILEQDERLPADWQVAGTTGYDFMDQVGALLHPAAAQDVLQQGWRTLTGDERTPLQQLRAARQRMIERHFPAERAALVDCLLRLARQRADTRDWSAVAIDRALSAVLQAFPVYRSYAGAPGRSSADQQVCAQAWDQARQILQSRPGDPAHDILAFLDEVLGATPMPAPGDADESLALRAEALRRFQQLTPPLAAKALEDTLFYRYGPLLSRNEVGAAPGALSLPADDFVAKAQQRGRDHPGALLATATHDHKRGEDVRARLAAAAENAQGWHDTLAYWAEHWLAAPEPAATGETATPPDPAITTGKDLGSGSPASPVTPSLADRYMLLQTLVGAWPTGVMPHDRAEIQAYAERVSAWQTKALREAKLHTDWYAPDPAYEAACEAFLQSIFATPARLEEVAELAKRLICPGLINSLAQVLLRHGVPGVPDIYQGREFWDFSLVDPDNRREVDYDARRHGLDTPYAPRPHLDPRRSRDTAHMRAAKHWLHQFSTPAWTDGLVKQTLIHRCLAHRRQHPRFYAEATLQPLRVVGPKAGHLLAFARRLGQQTLLIVVPLHCAQVLASHGRSKDPSAADEAFWQGTAIDLSDMPPVAQAWDLLAECPAVRSDAGQSDDSVDIPADEAPGEQLPAERLLLQWPVTAWFWGDQAQPQQP